MESELKTLLSEAKSDFNNRAKWYIEREEATKRICEKVEKLVELCEIQSKIINEMNKNFELLFAKSDQL